jgi:hypothetical protein
LAAPSSPEAATSVTPRPASFIASSSQWRTTEPSSRLSSSLEGRTTTLGGRLRAAARRIQATKGSPPSAGSENQKDEAAPRAMPIWNWRAAFARKQE